MNKNCPKCGHSYDADVSPELQGACPRCMAELLRSRAGDASTGPVRGDDAPPLAVGQKLRGFEVLEYLGRGGMGFVFKAKQSGLDRLVALKVLAPRLAASPEFAARFAREAKALAALSHPNIVQVFDYGEENGVYFLAMEFVDGASLRKVLSSQKLPPDAALRYVPQICDALEYAHGRGVIHRDIKPENILIDKVGNLKIADFGLAKMAGSAAAVATQATPEAPTAPAAHATLSGQVMGTPHYMAPEQVENTAAVDHRADIYSLGVVFYEMLTGELPIGRFPSPSQRVQVDVRFDEVVLKALEKEPERRYQNVTQMKDDVTTLGGPGGKPGRKPWILVRDGKERVEIGPDGIRVEDGDEKVEIGDLGGILKATAAFIPGAERSALKPRMSWLALTSVMCVPISGAVGILAGVLAYLLSSSVGDSGGLVVLVGVISAVIVLSMGLILGISALVCIGRSGGRLWGRGLAWAGISGLPVVGLFLFAGLVHEWRNSSELPRHDSRALEGQPERKATYISWGQPDGGLQAGLVTKRAKYEVGEPIEVFGLLLNAGTSAVGVPDTRLLGPPWSFRLEDVSGRRSAVEFHSTARMDLPAKPRILRSDQSWAFSGALSGPLWSAGCIDDSTGATTPSNLPPGQYRVIGTYRGQTGAGYWQGTVATGPVEIEIVGPGGADAAAETAPPVAKYLAKHRDAVGLGSCFIGEVTAIGSLAPFTIQSEGELKLREIESSDRIILPPPS